MQARALPIKEKATLAHLLIEELDTSNYAVVEQLWMMRRSGDMTRTKGVI